MNDRPIEAEDLAAIAALPADDPRRVAFEARPGARARLRAYEAFMAGGGEATPEQRAEAEARLGAMLAREIGIPPARETGPAPAAAGKAGAPWWQWLMGPGLRPVLATAAVIAVVLVALNLERADRPASAPVFRDGGSRPAPEAWDARPTEAALPSGGLQLRWTPAPGADAYAVEFLAADLTQVARVDGVSAEGLTLEPGRLPAGLTPGTEVLWRVVARRGADPLGVSQARPLRVP